MMHRATFTRRAFLGTGVAALLSERLAAATGDRFPGRPLRLIVPAPPGGVQDVQSRRLVPNLTDLWQQPVVVDNRPGASGSIALEQLIRATADGYTMAMAPVAIAVTPHLTKVPYDPLKDLRAVTKVTAGPFVLAAPSAAPFDNLKQLIDHARRDGKSIGIGGFGSGTLANLVVLLLARLTGVPFSHIPYAGGGQQVTDLLGGQVPLLLDFAPVLKQHLAAGSIKAIGVTGERRMSVLPDIPTLEEQGAAGMRAVAWQGIVVPAQTDDTVVRTLNAGFVQALNDPAVRAAFGEDGAEIGADSPEAFGAFIRDEHARWGRLIRDVGLKLN